MRFLNSLYIKGLVAVLIGFILFLESVVNPNKDFDVFIAASKLVFEGKTCYEVWIHLGQMGLKYFYSPLFAVLLYPIKDLPQTAYNLIWLSLNLVLVYRTFKLFPHFLNLSVFTLKQKQVFYLLTVLCILRFFYDAFGLGQMTFVLVWGSLESINSIRKGNKLWGAALLALIINIKLLPITLLAYLIYTKELKAAFYTLFFFVLYLFLPALVLGTQFNAQLLHDWLGSLTATNGNSISEDYGRQSLSSFVPALLMDTPLQFDLKRNLFNFSTQSVNTVLNLCRLAILLMFVFIFGEPFKKPRQTKTLFFHLALICLVTPLFFPHQGKYSFFYLLPAQAYCIYALIKLKSVRQNHKYQGYYRTTLVFFVLSFALLTLTTDGLIGRWLSDLCEYLQFITIGTFSLLAALISVKPRAS